MSEPILLYKVLKHWKERRCLVVKMETIRHLHGNLKKIKYVNPNGNIGALLFLELCKKKSQGITSVMTYNQKTLPYGEGVFFGLLS